jgi:hypothetical protein
MFHTAALTVLCLALSSLPVYAADADHAELATGETSTKAVTGKVDRSDPTVEFTPLVAETAAPSTVGNMDRAFGFPQIEKPASRPRALPALYISLASLQAFDAYSTVHGLSGGAQESNPLMQHIAGNTLGFIALKAATAAVPMILAERMWKHNKVGAIALMVVANGVSAAVAANNAQVLHQLR